MKTPTFALLVCAAALPAQTVKTIVNNGSTGNRYDIVILGDGYQANEQSKFDNDCLRVTNRLFAVEPYKTVKRFFNVHTVFRASKQSGADHPDANPPIVKDTVYNASYNTGGTARCLYIKNTSQAYRDAALAPAVEGRVMVVVNDKRYGGCAGAFAVSYNGSSLPNVQVHEFGHSFAGLADEYDYPNNRYTGSEPGQKNVTANSSGAKWQHWIGSHGISAFEGARYYKYGLWRPASNCIMRSLGAGHCAVCAEQVVLKAYATVNTIENPQPSASRVVVQPGKKQAFSFTHLAPNPAAASVKWTLDGQPIPNASGSSHTVDTTGLGYGDHTLRVEVVDNTAFVRLDPALLLNKSRSWTLHIPPPPIPDYDLFYAGATSPSVPAGGDITIATVVRNFGGAVAPVAPVEHFLSQDQQLDSSDIYLGGYELPPLAISATDTNIRNMVRVPAFAKPGTWYLLTAVNRSGSVKELSTSNNNKSYALTVQPPACGPQLEYSVALNYPADEAELRGSTGGSLSMEITAPCQQNMGYLVLLSCSGTAPGTPLGSSLLLPLNLDACSTVFFANANSAVTPGFLGRLDAQGRAQAKLILPGGISTKSIQAHLAALIYDPANGAFLQTSNAVLLHFKP